MNANIRRVKKNPAHPSMGDADTTHHEFLTNIRRDKAASSVGHKDILTFQSVALNSSEGFYGEQSQGNYYCR